MKISFPGLIFYYRSARNESKAGVITFAGLVSPWYEYLILEASPFFCNVSESFICTLDLYLVEEVIR